MYTKYTKPPARTRIAENYIKELIPGVDDGTARVLYEERIRLFEILDVCLDMSTYLLVLSLRATSKIDQRGHLHVNDHPIGYSRAAMQEMLVIRVRDFFQVKKDKPDEFRFQGFHQVLYEMGLVNYPMPNLETNNAIARIIKRRNFYSSKRSTDKNESSLEKNRIHALDLITAVSYMSKVEEHLHKGKAFDPFERLLNDELGADRPLVLRDVYEVVTGQDHEVLNYSEVLETLPNGDQVVDGDYEDTPGFTAYQSRAKKELQRIKLKVEKIIR